MIVAAGIGGAHWLEGSGDGISNNTSPLLEMWRAEDCLLARQQETDHLPPLCWDGAGGLDAPLADLEAAAWALGGMERPVRLDRSAGTDQFGDSSARGDGRGDVADAHVPPAALAATICAPEFTWDCGWAERTVACESSGDPNAVGSEWYQGELWYFVGLWQIATRDTAMIPTLQDPVTNTLEAHWKYLHGGVAHWPVCGRG